MFAYPPTPSQRPPLHVAIIASAGSGQVWTDMPSARTEFRAETHTRLKIDLSLYKEFRLTSSYSVSGAAGAFLSAEYSSDESSWAALESGGTAVGDLNIDPSAPARAVGAWVPLASAAMADVFIRIMGYGGNGTTDPSFRQLAIQFR
jgi:hypothetical protein